MAFPPESDRIVERGQFGTVEYAVRANGKTMEAKEWLESQDESKQASFSVLFKKISDHRLIKNKTQFRPLRDDIYEFKRSGDRILCYALGDRKLLTHHISKGGSKKCPKREMDRADRIASEHIKLELEEQKKLTKQKKKKK